MRPQSPNTESHTECAPAGIRSIAGTPDVPRCRSMRSGFYNTDGPENTQLVKPGNVKRTAERRAGSTAPDVSAPDRAGPIPPFLPPPPETAKVRADPRPVPQITRMEPPPCRRIASAVFSRLAIPRRGSWAEACPDPEDPRPRGLPVGEGAGERPSPRGLPVGVGA